MPLAQILNGTGVGSGGGSPAARAVGLSVAGRWARGPGGEPGQGSDVAAGTWRVEAVLERVKGEAYFAPEWLICAPHRLATILHGLTNIRQGDCGGCFRRGFPGFVLPRA